MTRWLPVLTFLFSAAVLVGHNLYIQPWTLDDAYISFRYVENWVLGHGPVFNPGEYVEGYTTFLWVALLSLGHWAGLPIEPLAKWLAMAFALGTLLLLSLSHRIAPKLDARASALATFMTGTCGIFTAWVMSGMEVALVAFWVTLAVLLHLRAREISPTPEGEEAAPRKLWSTMGCSVACVLATMSRPEAVLVFLVLFCDRLILSIKRRDMEFFVFGLVFSAIYLPYFAVRFWYYGQFLPNTFYAKVGDTAEQVVRGWNYTRRFFASGLTVTAAGYAGVMVAGGLYRRSGGLLAVAALLLVHTVYVVLVGGDVMPAYRFFSGMLPLFALLGAHVLAPHVERGPALLLACALILSFNLFQMRFDNEIYDRVINGNVGKKGKEVGLWLKGVVPPDTVIATNTAGSIPFFSKLPTIDTLGLNDETIARRHVPNMGKGSPGHEKGDGAYVLSRKPDIVQFGSAGGNSKPAFLGDQELFALPAFREQYVLRTYQIPGGSGVTFYVRRDREAALGLPVPPTVSADKLKPTKRPLADAVK
jgi:arabinofuranosyltransferase